MGDIEDYFPEKGVRRPYPSLHKLARKKDSWQRERGKKRKGKRRKG